jgi:uncharacterized protein
MQQPPAQAPVTKLAIIKVASRCNYNCKYCYMYNLGDNTYKNQPKVMPDDVMLALHEKVRNHCLTHGLTNFSYVLHGGEPLLAGEAFFRKFVQTGRDILGAANIESMFLMQTNGSLVTEEACKWLDELGIMFSISIDGTKAVNDSNRIDHAGRGTYDATIAGLKTAQRYGFKKFSPGILTVINVFADPVEQYEHYKSLGVLGMDMLLPITNWDSLPPGYDSLEDLNTKTLYGDWLVKVFDRWLEDTKPRMSIRMFELAMATIIGNDVMFEYFGTQKNEYLVVETDGSMEAVDGLKSCGDGFTKAGVNVLTHEIDDALATDLALLYHLSHQRLCAKCNNCPIHEVCGAGYTPHRYSKKNGFNNPSVYCHDLVRLLTHIQKRVLEDLPAEVLEECGVGAFTYEEVISIIENPALQLITNPDHVAQMEAFRYVEA